MLSILFPKFCIGCGFVGDYICTDCFKKILIIKNNRCIYCGKNGTLGLTHVACRKTKGIDGCVSFYKYSSLIKDVIVQSKYRRAHLVLSSLLGAASPSFYKTIWKWKKMFSPVVVPIPLHSQRELERGFNQSNIIGNHIAKTISLPIKNILIRTKNTKHLANIKNDNDRRMIINNAFKYVGEGVPETALLIDDVITTNSTVGECAKVLKKFGVRTVLAFSLAK